MGETEQVGIAKPIANGKNYMAEPVKRSSNSSHSGRKQDPYVARATERVKIKIRNRMFQVIGGHGH